MALADPPAEHRLQVLNDVWRVVSCLTNAGHYVSCAEVWVQFAVRHFSVRGSDESTIPSTSKHGHTFKLQLSFSSLLSVSYIHVSLVMIIYVYTLSLHEAE